MIDTLMALWNRGYGGRGIILSIVFFVICISISLLLISVQGPWAARLNTPKEAMNPPFQSGTASATSTGPASGIQPLPDNTVTIYGPSPTPTTAPTHVSCSASQGTGHTSNTPLSSPTRNSGQPIPTPTRAHPTPTATPRPSPTPTATSTPVFTPTPSPTTTSTPTPTPSPTPSPTATSTPSPTPTPAPSPTATNTPVSTPTVTATPSPTATSVPTVTPTATVTVAPSPTWHVIPLTGQRTLCSSNSAGDNLSIAGDGPIFAVLKRDMWFILGGSALGTGLFYLLAYWLTRGKKV